MSATSFTRNRLGEEQERRPVLAIQEFNLRGISVSSVHVAVSIVRQRSTENLSTRLHKPPVTQRTNEVGVRMALGASSGEILLSFGKRGLALTLAGLAIGLVLAAIAAGSMTALLYGFRPNYLPTVSVVSFILLAVAALACFVPARRASRVDPAIALRNE